MVKGRAESLETLPIPDTGALGAVFHRILHRQVLEVVLLVGDKHVHPTIPGELATIETAMPVAEAREILGDER